MPSKSPNPKTPNKTPNKTPKSLKNQKVLKNLKKISVIIPALNEEKAIRKVLKSIPSKKLREIGYETEIMVIDNGS